MKNYISGLLLCLFLIATTNLFAQKILLDDGIRAGELQFFPVLGNENNYYYLLDKVRIAQKNGMPQFSFIKYEKVVRDNTKETNQAEAGGFIHALLEFHIPEDLKKEAERELRRVNPNAKVLGPVMYESGKVAVITALKEGNDDRFIKKIVGVGNAPILEGQKMAIGMEVTRDGAELLRAFFEMPASQISLAFDMTLSGYRSPKRVTIHANYDKIYKHKTFEAAAVTPVLSTEINTAFKELRESKAIEAVIIGDDKDLEQAFNTVYGKLINILFNQTGNNGTLDLEQISKMGKGQTSMLDRMTAQLGTTRTETKEMIKAKENQEDQENEGIGETEEGIEGIGETEEGIEGIGETEEEIEGIGETEEEIEGIGETEEEIEGIGETEEGIEETEEGIEGIGETEEGIEGLEETEEEIEGLEGANDSKESSNPKEEKIKIPELAIGASLQLKKVRQSGVYFSDLEKYGASSISVPFSENLSIRPQDCPECFAIVSLDKLFGKQREITIQLGGLNADDFKNYIDFVNVKLRKTHESGQVTFDEVKIDRSKFNETGNNFKMVYGTGSGDEDVNLWIQYDYQINWNFFGGQIINTEWMKNDGGMISLSPPLLRKRVDFEADKKTMNELGVRSIIVKTYYQNRPYAEQRINTSKEIFEETIDAIVPSQEDLGFDYEVSWYFKDGDKNFTSSKRTSKNSFVPLDKPIKN